MKITVNEAEVMVAALMGGMRSTRQVASTTTMGSPRTLEGHNVHSFGAELAFCRYYNVYPDLSMEPRSTNGDCRVGHVRIDVKHTVHAAGRLAAQAHHMVGDCDIYALVRGLMPDFDFAGWVWAAEIIRPENLRYMYSGSPVKSYVIENGALRAPGLLRQAIEGWTGA